MNELLHSPEPGGLTMKTVTAAVICRGSEVLLTRRAPDQKLAGHWEFPGGKVESGETLSECLERELAEELGLRVTATNVLVSSVYHYDHGAINLVAMETTINNGTMVLTVHDKAEWVAVDHLLKYQLAPADIPIAHFLQDRRHAI